MERLIRVGTVAARSSVSVSESRIGIGMEKLDRDAYDPEKVYDKLAATGAKWVRLLSGWQKTEKEKGVYDFGWLDSQVDNLRQRNMIPWLCLSYGNGLYDPLAGQFLGAVGCPPIRTEEALTAWRRYVSAAVSHFAGRIEYYEVWNEPEGGSTWRPEPNAAEYAAFCRATADAVKSADPAAKIITGAHYEDSMHSFNTEFANGTLAVSDAVSFHSYQYDERKSVMKAKAFRTLAAQYGFSPEVIQGETGSQSRSGGAGALGWVRSDGDMQTKQLIRHLVGDFISDVKFTSIFNCVDTSENLDAPEGKPITSRGYFGLLEADYDLQQGCSAGEYREKPSYYAVQNLCALFGGVFTPTEMPVIFRPEFSARIDTLDTATERLLYGGFSRPNGSRAFAYWCCTDLVTEKGYDSSVSFELFCGKGTVRLTDPKDGAVYEIPEEIMTTEDGMLYRFKHLPVKDYPLILTVGDFTDFD